jgi:predicted ATPase/class 3 adenylate cyclase
VEPLGHQALLFTDIEGSTALLQRVGHAYADLLDVHHRILRDAITAHGSRHVHTEGDAFFAVFGHVEEAVAAALDAQLGIAAHEWPEACDIRVRMGVHVGEIGRSESGLIGMPLHEAARISNAAHGGQVLLSEIAADTVDVVPPRSPALEHVAFRRLGDYDLKDVGHVALVQLLHPDLRDVDLPPRTSGRGGNNLPTHLTGLVGRDAEIAELGDLVGGHRLVSLLGAGGVGKTRLALAVAATMLDQFRGGVWLVQLSDLDDGDDVVTTVAATLGLGTVPEPVQQLVEHLRDRRALVVLDNCEHLLDACSSLANVLTAACPELHLLATSQRPLDVAGERCCRVPSLAPDDAVELFRRRAALVRPDLARDDRSMQLTDDAAIRRICERLDGIPLPIELAAARCRSLSIQEIESRLVDRFRLLTGGTADALPRHQTLLATVDWSFGLLEPFERVLAYRLAVFRGGADLDAVEAVCALGAEDGPDVVDLVDSLHAKSLVQADAVAGRTRVRFAETIRQYAAARLDETGQTDALTERHARYFAGLLRDAAVGWRTPARVQWLRRCHIDADNLAAACDWLEHHDPDAAASMLGHAHVWLTAEDDPAWLDRLRRMSDRSDLAPDRRAVVAALRALLAEGYGREGADVASTYATRALAELDLVHDPHERLTVLANVALGLRAHDRAQAIALSERAVDESRHLGDAEATAIAMYDLILLRPEDDPATRALRAELIAMLDSNGSRWWGITPLVDEALDAHQHGQHQRAIACLDRAELILATVDLDEAAFTDEAVTFTVWSTFVRAEQGDVDGALLISEDMLGRLGDTSPHQSKVVLSTHGHALWLAGRRDDARRAFERAVDRADGWRFLVHAIATVGLAALELDAGRTDVARGLVARLVADEQRQGWLRARAHDVLARAAIADADEPLARVHLMRADELYRTGGYVVPPALVPAHEQLRQVGVVD